MNPTTTIHPPLASLTRLFSDENAQHVSRTLDNLEKVSGELADHRGDITRLIGQLDTLSRQANASLTDISRLAGTANGLLHTDTGPWPMWIAALRSLPASERGGSGRFSAGPE